MTAATSPSPSAADQLRAASPAPGSSEDADSVVKPCPLATKHWVEVQLLGEDDAGIADELCAVTGPDGVTRTSRTDEQGWVRVEGLPSGSCRIAFPNLDAEVWDFVRSDPAK